MSSLRRDNPAVVWRYEDCIIVHTPYRAGYFWPDFLCLWAQRVNSEVKHQEFSQHLFLVLSRDVQKCVGWRKWHLKSVCNIRPVVVVPQHQHTNQLMFNISQYRVLLSPSHQSSRGLQDYRRHPVYFLNHHLTAVSKLETRKRQVQVHEVFIPHLPESW